MLSLTLLFVLLLFVSALCIVLITCLGKRELVYMLLVYLLVYLVLRFVFFLFLLEVWVGCGL